MIKIPKLPKIFIGWWTVLACGVMGLLGMGFVTLGFSVLFKPIAAELGFNRAITSLAPGVQSLGQGIWGPTGGWAGDRFGPRRVILIGLSLLSLGLVAMYFVNSLWAFLLVWGIVIGAGFTLGCMIITDKAIVNWFVKKSGIALNIKFAIQSLAGLLLLPAVAWLITAQGWRMTCLIAGIVIALVSFPLTWFFIKPHPPEHYGLLPDGAKEQGKASGIEQNIDGKDNHSDSYKLVEFTFRQTIKTPAFWMLMSLGFISGLAMPAMGIHLIPFLTDAGYNPVKAAALVGFMATVSVPGRLLSALIVDRIDTRHLRFIMVAGYLLQTIGVAIFIMSKSSAITVIYVWFLLFGIGQAVSQSVNLPILARYFGRKSYGSILGSSIAMHAPMGLLAPVYVGWVFDTTGSYLTVFTLIVPLLAASGVVSFFILPPKPPVLATPTPKAI